MIDGVPYAAGSGYLLKAISSFLASYPTYSDFVSALVAGTLPIDISFNSAGWSTQPTPLNKANLLDDTVAATLKTLAGLSSNPATPNAALSALATAVAGGAKIATGSYTGNGLYGSSHPCSLTFPFPPEIVWMLGYTKGGVFYQIPFIDRYEHPVAPMFALGTTYMRDVFGGEESSQYNFHPYACKSADGKTLNYYCEGASYSPGTGRQFNESGYIYYFVALG